MGAIEQVFQNLIDSNRDLFASMPSIQYEGSTSRQRSHQNEREQPNAHSSKRKRSLDSSTPGQGLAKVARNATESIPGQDMDSTSVNQGFHRTTRSQLDANAVWTLTPHGEIKQDSSQVFLKLQERELVAVLEDRYNYARETISLEVLKKIASVIDKYAYYISTYREILYNADYQQIYGIGYRDVLKVDEEGKEYKENDITGVCQECRIVLPWEYLTVDHQRPQKGGENEAILKTFRILGLTMGGPKGRKGKIIQVALKGYYKLKGENDDSAFGAYEHFLHAPEEIGDLNLRYTLNNKGIIFYTLIRRQRNQFALYNACMHGLLNMKPLCSICNSRRGNQGIKF